jgi:hypothetical protein
VQPSVPGVKKEKKLKIGPLYRESKKDAPFDGCFHHHYTRYIATKGALD